MVEAFQHRPGPIARVDAIVCDRPVDVFALAEAVAGLGIVMPAREIVDAAAAFCAAWEAAQFMRVAPARGTDAGELAMSDARRKVAALPLPMREWFLEASSGMLGGDTRDD